MFTSDTIYWRPLKPRITVKSLDNSTTLYSYDPWTDAGTSTKPIFCTVTPQSPNHQGTFIIQIEDQTLASSSIDLNCRVIIECGKQSTQMTRLISGLIRQKGTSRGADGKILQTFSGSSTGIRLNERVTYFVREAAKLAQDAITIDVTDATMKADVLLQSAINLGVYPTVEAYDATGISASSDVENFIPSASIEYGELQDVVNLIQEASDGEVFIDVNDVVRFRHALQSPVAGTGFTIKNKKESNDNANDTMYLRGKNWDYTASMSKYDNYSNHVYSVLPSESFDESNLVTIDGTTGLQNGTQEVAQKFRPPHSHFLCGDLFFAGYTHVGTTAARANPLFRIAGPDVANTPNNLPVIVNPSCLINSGPVTSSESENIVRNDTILYSSTGAVITNQGYNLDTTKDYWLIISSTNTGGSGGTAFYFVWDFRSVTSGTGCFFRTSGTASSFSNAGTGWGNLATHLMWFAMPRRRSQAFHIWDPKAIKAMTGGTTRAGLIETTLSSLPSYIKTKEAMYKYLSTQIYSMAKPRYNFNMGTVTAPNIPPLPGDPILIVDSELPFLSNSGQRAFMTTCGDMTYSWGSQGGQGLTYQAPTILSVLPVAQPSAYR